MTRRRGVHPSPPARGRRGFTLLEVIVVVALLGVVAGVTLPALAGSPEATARGTVVAGLLSLLEQTRRIALERGTRSQLHLDPATGSYVVTVGGGRTCASAAEGRLQVPSGTTIHGPDGGYVGVFGPTGIAVAESLAVTAGGQTDVILVDPWTGVARVR